MIPLLPSNLSALLERLPEQVVAAARAGVTAVADEGVAQMKQEVGSGGAHRRGTKTTASPGGPPAVITGDLRRSITHDDVRGTEEISVRVGPSDTEHSNTGRRGATCSQIGEYLEEGTSRMPAYPFARPAEERTKAVAVTILLAALDEVGA